MQKTSRTKNVLLWTAQVLVAALFLFAGVAKLMMPAEVLAAQSGMPGTFLHFIAVCEVLGAAGLILPGLLGIQPFLTPLAAAGLTIIMLGAVITSLVTLGPSAALLPLVVGVMTAVVARSRWPLSTPRVAIRPAL